MSETLDNPQLRIKAWLNDNLDKPAILKNDTDPANVSVMLDNPAYPLSHLTDKSKYDVYYVVGNVTVETLFRDDHAPYGYREQVTLTIFCIESANVQAYKLAWNAEKELRKVAENNFRGSLRLLRRGTKQNVQEGGNRFYEATFQLDYKRSNEVVPTHPTITWGPIASRATYIIPNIIRRPEDGLSKDVWLDPPTFSGSLPQRFGSKSLEIEFECDLDVEPAALTWKRHQTASKYDTDNWDVFREIWHGGVNQPCQVLTLKQGGPSFEVCLIDYHVDYTAEGRRLRLKFREYRTTSASSQTYKLRLGIS